MLKINKTKARNLYNNGATIFLLPCKVRLSNKWIQACTISKAYYGDFDAAINSYEYFNCNYNELGRYAAYFIES